MTDQDAKELLRASEQALEKYREQLLNKGMNPTSDYEYNRLKRVIGDIEMRSHVTGASGRACGRCGGSGREP